MASTSQLSLEIIEFIIDCVAAVDTIDNPTFLPAVKACSLVCHKLLPRARTHIFSSININYVSADKSLQIGTPLGFARLISQNPGIASYVTSLKYCMEEEDLAIDGFTAALGSLVSLKSLSVLCSSWEDMPDIILNWMCLPTLVHLNLNCGDFPLSSLTLCSGLKSLGVEFHASESDENINQLQERPLRLESMDIHGADNFFPQLLIARRFGGKPIIDTRELRKVSLYVFNSSVDGIQEFFESCKQLTHIEIGQSDALLGAIGFAKFFLPSLQTLQYIELAVSVGENGPWQRLSQLLVPLISGLESVRGKNVIESIKIIIETLPDIEPGQCGDEWAALDKVFTQFPYGWEKLRLLSFFFLVHFWDNGAVRALSFANALWTLQVTRLRGLSRSKKFNFDFEVFPRAC